MKKLVILLLMFPLVLKSQPLCQFSHYSTEDGLPQYTIMDMLQDQKGFMWFATWDGLSKYDGFRFRNYKVGPESSYVIKSNRVQKIRNDKYNRIWLITYDGSIHCFNPENETYWGPQLNQELKNSGFQFTGIDMQPSGRVWLRSLRDGCILVKDSLFETEYFSAGKGNIKSNAVNAVFEDSEKNSWILTTNGITQLSGSESKYYFYSITKDKSHPEQNFFCASETGNEILFGSQNGKIWKYTKDDGKFSQITSPFTADITKIISYDGVEQIIISRNEGMMLYKPGSSAYKIISTKNTPTLKSNEISAVFFDKSANLWFDTSNEMGIYKLNIATGAVKFYQVYIEDASVSYLPPYSFVFEDINGSIWVQPRGGGFSLYNKSTDRLESFYNNPLSADKKFSNIIHSATSDKQGNLWMCTRSHGLEKIVFGKNYFRHFAINPQGSAENQHDVRAVFEDKNKILWVATKDKRVTLFDRQKKMLGRINNKGYVVPDAFLDGMVYAITQDNDGNMWLGTKGEGLLKFNSTSKPLQFRPEKFVHEPSDIYSLSDNNVYCIYQDRRNNIWIGTYGNGLNLLNKDNTGKYKFYHAGNELKNYPIREALRVRYISQDKKGNICLGTTAGLVMCAENFHKPGDIRFKIFTKIPGDIHSLSNNDVHGILINQKGTMFLATFGGGVNEVTKTDNKGFPLSFKSITAKDGLSSDITLAMNEDEQGKIWISSENNLSRFNPESNTIESFSSIKGLMSGKSFSEASSTRLSSNEMVFGNSGGLLTFFPGQIINSNYKPYIALTNLQLFNIDQPISENTPLHSHIDNLNELILSHKQNFFTIEYSALDFINPDNIVYAYKLENFDKDWNYVQKQRKANYTNLPKGEYIFKVKSTNSEGVWTNNERTIRIVVKPSFWETPWAYILYLLIISGIIYSIFRIFLTFYHLRQNMELEKKMSDLKLRFFTDISHEIRTPLTMITAPLDFLMNDSKTPETIKKQLQAVTHNTSRLLRLVNQILDFRKIQFMHLKVYETDLASLIQDVCENFTDIALSKNINFKFNDLSEGAKVWVDPDCVDKIAMNLLSNAFKFTPEKRMIQVTVTQDEKTVSFQVKDEGPGIPGEKQKNLFTRFVSINTDKSNPGTGIGLSMVKDLVDKHQGKIQVESDPEKGTSFIISFMKGISHFGSQVEIVAASGIDSSGQQEIINTGNINQEDENTLHEKTTFPTVMIVEDDPELRNFMQTILEDEYKIIVAENGREGLELAISRIPDFIVSDIMMPEMDGIELLQQLKTNLTTSHIPVILLSAKTTIESKLEGLSYGADDYITKPFSVTYFRARIANLITQRKHLQQLFLNHPESLRKKSFEPQPFMITSQDESLINSVLQVIEENMDNFDFTIDNMRENLGMSRSAFFKKIKSLTGLAPVEFVRDIKMKRAAQLLSSGEYRVKEVTYMVGFSDSKYFAKCFREKYGLTPIEYKQK